MTGRAAGWRWALRPLAHPLAVALCLAATPGAAETGTSGNGEMEAARDAFLESHGGGRIFSVTGDRIELRTGEGQPALFWDVEAAYGGDIEKIVFSAEGEYAFQPESLEELEIQALYRRAVSPFFDLELGLRHDFEPDPSRNFAVLGMVGTLPLFIEGLASIFISDDGDVSARLEGEYDLLITQRLILQPRVELNLAVQEVAELGLGQGLTDVEGGLRLRYELRRRLAPYLGVTFSRDIGETANFTRAEDEDVGAISAVAGVRFWF